MTSNIQRNVGNRIYRGYPPLHFIENIWQLNTAKLPQPMRCNLPWPLRRLLVSFTDETRQRLQMSSGPAPSRLAVANAQHACGNLQAGTYGLVEDAPGRWRRVDGYGEKQNKWQKLLTLLKIRKGSSPGGSRPSTSNATSEARRELSNDEAVFAQQLMQMFCSNIRSWVSGIVIHDTSVTFWYGDRMGMIVSKPFSCIEQPNLLSLAGVAIGATDRVGLGICPFLFFQAPTPFGLSEADMDFRYASFFLQSPRDDQGEFIDGAISFGESSWDGPDVPVGQLVGRGTAVIPVRATSTAAIRLFGRAHNSVMKLAWASSTAPVEDATVRFIRRRLREDHPTTLDHVTYLKCSVTRTMSGAGLPRAGLFVREDSRILRVQVLERYNPLETVNSAQDFATCFKDAVKAHHWVHTTSQILHRDISVDNIMVRIIDGQQRGVLVDWDLAKPETPRGRRPKMRLGTVPYMSADFYAEWWAGEHYYRHDLEAFLYLLTWFCACFDPSTRTFQTQRLARWYDDHNANNANSKRYLEDHYIHVVAHAHPEYRALADKWVLPLATYFSDVTGSWYARLNALYRLQNGERWGPWLDFDSSDDIIRNEIREVTRRRERRITFTGFLRRLAD